MEKIRFYKGDLVSGTKYHCSIGKLFDMFQGLLIYIVMDRVHEIGFSGTRNQPKNGCLCKDWTRHFLIFCQIFGIFVDFSKWKAMWNFDKSSNIPKKCKKCKKNPCVQFAHIPRRTFKTRNPGFGYQNLSVVCKYLCTSLSTYHLRMHIMHIAIEISMGYANVNSWNACLLFDYALKYYFKNGCGWK